MLKKIVEANGVQGQSTPTYLSCIFLVNHSRKNRNPVRCENKIFAKMFLSKVICSIAFVLIVKAQSSFGKPAEQYFHLCHRSDADFEECLKKSILEAKPYLMKGIEEIDLPPMDPFALSAIDFKENNQNFKFALGFSKVLLTGLNDMTVEAVTIEETEESAMTLNVTVKTPALYLNGKYFVNGRVLLIRLEGKGDIELNLTEPIMKISIKGVPVTNVKDNEKYLQVDSLSVDLNMKGGRAHLYNLFNGDKTLGKVANSFINDNFMLIFKGLKHLPEQWFSRNFERTAETVFGAWPITELLPQ